MSLCKDALNAATVDESRHIFTYKLEVKNAVGALLGFPTKAHIRKAEAALASKPSERRKKELRIALLKHEKHKVLFNKLSNYINDSSKEANYNRTLLEPRRAVENWRLIFAKRGWGDINPISAQQSAYTLSGLDGTVDRILKRRNKTLKRGKLSTFEIMMTPPDVIMSHVDFSGAALQLVNKALRVGDKDISMVNKFNTEYEDIRDLFYGKHKLKIGDVSNSLFNLNNSSMDGIEGFIDKTTGLEVSIIGEGVYKGIDSYKINEKVDGEYTDKEVWMDKEDLGATREQVGEALLSLYTDKLTNESLDGQLRKIVPTLLNWDIGKDGYIESKETGKALSYIKKKLDLMKKEGAREDGNRIAGIHEKIVEVPYGKPRKDGTRKTRKFAYRYVMIKQGESSVGEQYNTYLIDKHEISTRGDKVNGVRFIGQNKKYNFMGEEMPSEKSTYTQEDLDIVFEGGGYFKSNKINDFGRLVGKDNKPIKDSKGKEKSTHTKQYIDFQKMKRQPNENLIKDADIAIFAMRQLNDRVFLDTVDRTQKLEKKREALNIKIEKSLRKDNPNITDSKIKEYFEDIYSIGGIDSRVWWNSETQTLRTANSFAKKKEQNYVPHLYDKQNILLKQIPNQLKDLRIKLTRAKRANETEKVKQYELGIEHLDKLLFSMNDNDKSSHLVDLETTTSLKHITSWTDQTERRKDGDIYKEYLEGIYRTYHRNEVIVEMLDTIHTMQKLNETNVDGVIDYLKNRVKIAFGDSDTRATVPRIPGLSKGDLGYKQLSDKLNSVSRFWNKNKGASFTPESAEKLTKMLTTPATMRYLGTKAAIGNHSQIFNTIIKTGFASYMKANKIMNSKNTDTRSDWDFIVDNTGCLNLVTMFNDVMMQGGDLEFKDFGFVPGTVLPSYNMIEWAKLLSKGRDNFIKNPDKDIDDFILKLVIKAKSPKEVTQLKNLQNVNELRKRVNKAEIDTKKGEYYDIMAQDNTQTREIVNAQFKKLVGEISENKLRKMVSWKLSYAFNNKMLESAFTFTGGEETLRKTTIIMALLDAKQRGILGGNENTSDRELFSSNQAVKIARDAVYNTQFGMTPQYVGEGFNGIGRLFLQYKQYPTLQMQHDYNLLKRFTDANVSGKDGALRILKAVLPTDLSFTETIKNRGFKRKTESRKSYNPSDEYTDQEALAMGRFIVSRGLASTFASMASVVPFISKIMRTLQMGGAVDVIRSMENPALGLSMRFMVWGVLFMSGIGEDDEEDKAMKDSLNKIRFLVMPVLLGTMVNDLFITKEFWEEDDKVKAFKDLLF
tara:strand:+ start:11088 stop:14954 length:3867 start_codon:yes stop_codon:yes gene_type:complete